MNIWKEKSNEHDINFIVEDGEILAAKIEGSSYKFVYTVRSRENEKP
jgi:hypothetical protein